MQILQKDKNAAQCYKIPAQCAVSATQLRNNFYLP
jgi:hypothetical protein